MELLTECLKLCVLFSVYIYVKVCSWSWSKSKRQPQQSLVAPLRGNLVMIHMEFVLLMLFLDDSMADDIC